MKRKKGEPPFRFFLWVIGVRQKDPSKFQFILTPAQRGKNGFQTQKDAKKRSPHIYNPIAFPLQSEIRLILHILLAADCMCMYDHA